MKRSAIGFARSLVVGLALTVASGCDWFGLRPRTPHAPPTAEQNEHVRQVRERAQAAIDSGDYERARADFAWLVNADPGSAEAWERLGAVLTLQGRTNEAEPCFHEALARDHDYAEALIGLGDIEAQRGAWDQALKRYDAAIAIDPRRARAHNALGRVREAMGQPDEALASYFRALEFDANQSDVIRRIAAIQLARNQTDQALSRLDQAVELAPDDAETRDLRGLAHWKLHHVPEAIADFQAATQRAPDRADAFYHLALVLEATNQRADALRAADQAVRLAPTNSALLDLSQRLRR